MSPCLHVLATTSRPLSSALSFRTSLLLHLTFLLLLHHASRVTGTPPLTTTSGASVFLDIRQGSGGNDSESLVSVEPFSYGDAPNSSVCRRALGLASTHAAKCEVARDFSGCKFDSGFIPYLKFQYCYFESPIVPTILMVLWLLTLLGAFAVIADSFFSPSLIALARSMRMSQNLAGVTLLAFGNGAPDVFSAITAITTGDPEAPDEGLGLGFLMGSGLLVNTVTAGLIMIIRPFKTTRRPFIKDTLFYMSAVTWSAVILVRRMIYLSDAVGFICLYFLYVLVTWVSGRLHRKKKKSKVYLLFSDFFHRLADRCRSTSRLLCPCRKKLMDPHISKNEVVVADKLSNFEHRTYLQRLQRCFGSSRRTSNVLRKVSALRIRGSSKSTHVISEEVMTTDMPISNGYCIKGGDMVEKKDGEVKMVGFRPKSKIRDFRHRFSEGSRPQPPSADSPERTAPCPRIEVTAPEDESRQATISPQAPPSSTCLDPSSLLHQTSFSSPSNEHSLANRESSLRLSSSQRRSSLTHSTTSRRGSQITSEAAGVSSRLPSSMRRRSLVGPIGLRTRTPSMNQRRGSQRTGTIEQLPFVVRWIIASKEAEEKELAESTHSIYDRESAMDEKMKDASVQSEFRPSARKRHCSDSTQAPDITSILSTPRDMVYGSRLTAFSHSPSVSFPGKSPVAPTNRTPGNLQRLYRISSNSLPELDQIVDARTSGRQSILTPRPGLLKQDLGGHPPDLRVQFEESPLASVLGRPSTLKESIEEVEAEEYEDEEEMEGEGEEEEGEEGEMGEEDEEEDAFMRWASKGMWHHLVYSLCPIDIGEWKKISIPMKILQILQAPIFLLFRLTIPVVIEDLEPAPPATAQATETVSSHDLEAASIQGAADKIPGVTVSGSKLSVTTTATESQISFQSSDTVSTRVAPATSEGPDSRTDSRQPSISGNSDGLVDFEQLHGWCRLLNCFQCLLTPMLWVMLITIGGTSAGLHKIGNTDMPAVVIVLLISTCLAITIFVTSKWDRPPTPYHRPFFATLGFLTSVIWIYAIAHELVNSLETLGIVWEISEAILGISVMALASSIGDIMSNSLLAHNGYPRIAYAACSGSPLFNLLIGAGTSYTIKIARTGDHNAALSFTLTHALLFTFLLVVLTTNLIVATACNFEMRKAYGVVLILAYAVFLTLAILIEADVIVSPRQWHLLTGTE